MLKIKDNVDLKELENKGFIHKKSNRTTHEHYAYLIKDGDDFYPKLACCVWVDDKQVGVFNNIQGLDKVFDLIQAGLVEKVN